VTGQPGPGLERIRRLERRVERERARRREAERQVDLMARRAVTDPLTGAATELVLVDRLRAGLERAARKEHSVGLLVLDLDGFRLVNERHGSAVGDAVVREVGERLTSLIRNGDTVARVGGDEFAILLHHVDDADHLRRLADRVIEELARPFHVGDHTVELRAGIGLRVAGGREQAEAVLREADAALYVAKRGGRGRVVLFDATRPRAADRLEFELELRRALGAGEIRAWFQPVVDLATGDVVAAEALARWLHPERGLIPPDQFIAQAERADLVQLVTDAVLLDACGEAARWNVERPGHPLLVHVNISGHDLADGQLEPRVVTAVEAAGLAPDQLCLEITEGALVADDAVAQVNLLRLRERGIGFAIDDFGVQHASFSYLRRFRVPTLKIDRSFLAEVATESRDVAVLEGIVAMARALGMRTVAEGVETEEQAGVARRAGVDEGQGWLFGRPVPSADWRSAPWMQADALRSS
jgi:diguanylate cyclase (GGDEF)-like protein